MASIFPALTSVYEMDDLIISFLGNDNASLLNFSAVSHKAHEVLSNDFFRKCFEQQHPHLGNRDNIFNVLRESHPNNCWKVACCLLAKRDPGSTALHASFLQEGVPFIVSALQTQKSQLEEKNRAICGSHCQDPSSPIDQAWKAYAKRKEEADAYDSKFKELYAPIRKLFQSFLPDDVNSNIRIQLASMLQSQTAPLFGNDEVGEFFKSHSDQEIVDLVMDSPRIGQIQSQLLSYCDQIEHEEVRNQQEAKIKLLPASITQLIPSVRLIVNLFKEMNVWSGNDAMTVEKFRDDYEQLERKRKGLVNALEGIDRELTQFNPSSDTPDRLMSALKKHGLNLCHEYHFTMALEQRLVRLSALEECSGLIQRIIDGIEEPTPIVLDRIRGLINSNTLRIVTFVWGHLYHLCAQGVHEDRWSEKHFPEHLMILGMLVSDAVSQVQYALEETNTGSYLPYIGISDIVGDKITYRKP